MDTIHYFKLNNSGAFVARIHVSYRPDKEQSWKTWEPSGYVDICLHGERTQDLKDLGIADGTHVRLLAYVAGGVDNLAEEEYIFSSSSGKTASYVVSGTTLSNSLSLKSCG